MMMWFIAWQLAVTLAKERENSQEHDYSDLVSRYNLSDRDLNATSAWLDSYKEQNRKTSLGEGVMVMIWQIMKVHLYWYLLIRWSKAFLSLRTWFLYTCPKYQTTTSQQRVKKSPGKDDFWKKSKQAIRWQILLKGKGKKEKKKESNSLPPTSGGHLRAKQENALVVAP